MVKNNPKPKPVGRPARGGVTTTRRVLVPVSPREHALLTLACPPGIALSAWARDVVLEAIYKRKPDAPRRRTKRRGA
jgi:hypothetical protein